MNKTPEVFEPNKMITVYKNNLGQDRPEGTAKLIERIGTYPTTGQWQIGQWRLRFFDEYTKSLMEQEAVRPILEVGVPNENVPENDDFAQYFTVNYQGELNEFGEYVEKVKGQRGRPKGTAKKKVEKEGTTKRLESNNESTEPKRRGRPSLSPEEKARREAEKEAKPKRGRGRPKKVVV